MLVYELNERIVSDLRHLRNLMAFLPGTDEYAKPAEDLFSLKNSAESLASESGAEFAGQKEADSILEKLLSIEKLIFSHVEFKPHSTISSVTSLNEYLSSYPLQFAVRSGDIARIVSLAWTIHKKRVETGGIRGSEPIQVICLGNGALALSELILKIAKDSRLNFNCSNDLTKLEERHKNNPFILGLVEKQRQLSKETNGQHQQELTESIEQALAQEKCDFDLIVDSWMEPGTDQTPFIRQANAGGIIHILERFGATGIRTDAPFAEKRKSALHEDSYEPGSSYRSIAGWISHSTAQLQDMVHTQPDDFLDSHNDWNPPLSNAFLVQIRKDLNLDAASLEANKQGITYTEYPWEAELEQKGGPICPVIPLSDFRGKINYFLPFENLFLKLKKR
ncbi:MAG: hypothetical protein ACM3KM_02005 [Acidobacteriaceae bacterium]